MHVVPQPVISSMASSMGVPSTSSSSSSLSPSSSLLGSVMAMCFELRMPSLSSSFQNHVRVVTQALAPLKAFRIALITLSSTRRSMMPISSSMKKPSQKSAKSRAPSVPMNSTTSQAVERGTCSSSSPTAFVSAPSTMIIAKLKPMMNRAACSPKKSQ